jgi:hypothetical protein
MAGGYGSIAFMEREVLLRLLFPNTSGKSMKASKEKQGWECLDIVLELLLEPRLKDEM